jgi:hypothetical protein
VATDFRVHIKQSKEQIGEDRKQKNGAAAGQKLVEAAAKRKKVARVALTFREFCVI